VDALVLVERRLMGDEDRADDLALDEQRRARRQLGGGLAAQRAREQVVRRPALVRLAHADGQAVARAGVHEMLGERGARLDRRQRLEAVCAVVALQDDDRGVGDRALEVALDECVRVALAVGELERPGKRRLAVAVPGLAALPAAAGHRAAAEGEPPRGREDRAQQDHDQGGEPGSRERSLANATRLSALVVILLSAVFAAAGWLTFGRRSVARGRRERREARHRDRQSSFARTLQFADSEGDAHALVKRHLERSVPDAAIVVLQRNNSADRLEALTPIEPGTAFAEHLVDAGPRDCLAVRMGQTYEGGTSDDLLSCSLCGKAAAELTTCTPLLVQGEVIGSVLVAHQAPLDEDERIHVDETVTQAAPVIANMRTSRSPRSGRRPIRSRASPTAARSPTPCAACSPRPTGPASRWPCSRSTSTTSSGSTTARPRQGRRVSPRRPRRSSRRCASDFVGRQGGEEFIALLPDTGPRRRAQRAENVRARSTASRCRASTCGQRASASRCSPEDGLSPRGCCAPPTPRA
jgi:hypothetical protein